MKRLLALLVLGLAAVPVQAAWEIRGSWNGNDWGNVSGYTMIQDPGDSTYWTRSIVGDQFGGSNYDFKAVWVDPVNGPDWNRSSPNNSARIRVDNDPLDTMTFHVYDQTSWSDGWYPNDKPRVGYDDHEEFGWEIAGKRKESPDTMNDFGGGAAWHLTKDPLDGIYKGSFALAAGTYDYKFREQDSWDTSIGDGDFSNSGANNQIRVWNDNDLWNFELDLQKGRWRAYTDVASPDVNNDNYVNILDYVAWRSNNGTQAVYDAFAKHYGAEPPPPPPGWFVRGEFNDWGTGNEMEDVGGGHYTETITGLDPAGFDPPGDEGLRGYQYKIARSGWEQSAPPNNARIRGDTEFTFHFYESTTWNDGWSPNDQRRVGLEHPNPFTWEMMGDLHDIDDDDWNVPFAMTDVNSDWIYETGEITLNTPGTYNFKFRKQGDWDVQIGQDFQFNGPTATLTITQPGTWVFQMDLIGGRWRAVEILGGSSAAVPEPASFFLSMLGALAMTAIGSRKRRG